MPAPSAPPAPAPAAAPPAPAALPVVNVSNLPKPLEPLKPAKPGSARARLSQQLRQKFGGEEPPAPEPSKESPPGEALPPGAETNRDTTDDSRAGSHTPEPAPPPAEPAKAAVPEEVKSGAKPKVSPWKLVDEFKARAAKAEADLLEARKTAIPEGKVKEMETKLAEATKRIEAMTEDLRYFNAEKYDPEIVKANEQYVDTWKRAMAELSEITIKDPQSEQERALSATDMLELVNMPLAHARKIAEQLFGDFADDVMAQRKEIRRVLEEKNAKLADLKKNGAERDRQRQSQFEEQRMKLREFVQKTYDAANQEAQADQRHGHFFKPRQGETDADKEWNAQLEKGYKLVDEALATNPTNPKLTPDERVNIIRRHAAVRNRAASWGALRADNNRLNQRITELEKELSKYKQVQPPTGGRAGTPPPAPARGMAGLRESLHKIARPG